MQIKRKPLDLKRKPPSLARTKPVEGKSAKLLVRCGALGTAGLPGGFCSTQAFAMGKGANAAERH